MVARSRAAGQGVPTCGEGAEHVVQRRGRGDLVTFSENKLEPDDFASFLGASTAIDQYSGTLRLVLGIHREHRKCKRQRHRLNSPNW